MKQHTAQLLAATAALTVGLYVAAAQTVTPQSTPTTRLIAASTTAAARTSRPATTQISLNFKDAPLDAVLEHLSQVAGFVVVKEAPMDGRVTVISKQPISPAEAVTLLNTVLKANGYTAVQMGRILKIVSRDKAKKGNIPVYFGADPDKIEVSDDLITQVIPIRSVDAVKLKADLQPLVSPDADFTANAGSNTIMITDTSANVRRIVEIIASLDKRDSLENTILVQHLNYADATSAAKVITDIFKAGEPTQPAAPQPRFFRGREPQANQEPQGNVAHVTASADARTNTVVVTGPADTLKTIKNLLDQLDRQDVQLNSIRVKHLQYADATSAAKLITDIFNNNNPSTPSQPQGNSRQERFFRAMAAANGSQEQSAIGRVSASADARTNTIVVSGPAETLKVIDNMLDQLDANPAVEQTFFVYAVENGQAQNMAAVLNSLFGANTSGVNPTLSNANRQGNTGAFGNSSRFGSNNNRSGGAFGNGAFGSNNAFGGGGAFGSANLGGTPVNRTNPSLANVPANVAGTAAELMGQVYVVADPDTNSLLVATASKYEKRVMEVVKQLDRPVPQVLIKVLIAEVTHENASDFGVDFSVINARATDANGNMTKGQSAGTLFDTPTVNGGLVVSVLETNVTATLKALATQNKLDVLSRPYILASDNQIATMTVGQEVPIVTNTRVTDTGQTINTIQYQDIGIILNVTPHINPDGLVILDVAPQISQLTSSTVQISEGLSAPVFDMRSADTRVGIQNGQTIVIGGLMQDQKTKAVQKIPLLGDIPLIGTLFRRDIDTKTKTELLIFLTPHVAQSANSLQPLSNGELQGTKLTPNAVAPGMFQEYMRDMQRGAATQPTTAPATHASPPAADHDAP